MDGKPTMHSVSSQIHQQSKQDTKNMKVRLPLANRNAAISKMALKHNTAGEGDSPNG